MMTEPVVKNNFFTDPVLLEWITLEICVENMFPLPCIIDVQKY